MVLGMVDFKLRYYDALDSLLKVMPVSMTSRIKSVKLSISMESKDHLSDARKGQRLSNPFSDTTYAAAYWERTIKPKNMR